MIDETQIVKGIDCCVTQVLFEHIAMAGTFTSNFSQETESD